MSSYTPDTDLWLERSHLDGMVLGAVSYGKCIFFILTIQATIALTHKPRGETKGAEYHWMLLSYVCITFILATISFGGNAKFAEMIWIDLRDAPGGPAAIIDNEVKYWINMMALSCYYIMQWIMQMLLLHRCFMVWHRQNYIVVPMTTVFLAMVAMSILNLAESSGTTSYAFDTQLAYVSLQVGLTVIYTILVSGRLLAVQKRMKAIPGKEQDDIYGTVITMVVASATMYCALEVIFIFSFALYSNVSNLVFLTISHVQGISQLLIIIRVCRGRAVEKERQASYSPTPIAFKHSWDSAGTNPESSNEVPLTPYDNTSAGPTRTSTEKSVVKPASTEET
ncbi:hypothetical protein BU15DRAFT_48915 [Melanogaster broomeanus]|nr:hypothetical protein BU15DRAFT_48915 [Melanogaster broomeanus]